MTRGDFKAPSQPGKRNRWALNERFVIGQPGNPMMERWRLLQTPWLGIYVHFIYREDLDPVPHDHPWQFRSLVLRGGYNEMFWPDARTWTHCYMQRFRRWSWHRFPLAAGHRITSVDPGTVTLVLVGRKVRTWGFWHRGQFTDWQDALGLRPTEGSARKRPRDGEANDSPVLVDHVPNAGAPDASP
jgi:hypothetical protein